MGTLEDLAKKNVNLESKDESTGSTALHIAATTCRPNVVAWLLRKSADLTATDKEGFMPLHKASVQGHVETVKILIDGRADINEFTKGSGKTAITLCAERGNLECLQFLLTRGAEVNTEARDGSTPLMAAAHRGETEIVLHLLGKKASVNQVCHAGWSPLMYGLNNSVPLRGPAGETGEKKVNIDGVLGRKSTIEIIMLHKADVNQQAPDGLRPLIIAASHDRPAAVKWLLDARAEVNAQTVRGQNALILAASQDLPDVARALIVANADVNAANGKGESPLSLSVKYVHTDVEELLKKAGAVAPKGKKGKKGKKK